MGEPVPPDDGIEPHYQALIALHALSPDYRAERERLPDHYRGRNVGADLRLVAESDTGQVTVSARLAVLYDLAKAGYPGWEEHQDAYRELAGTAEQRRLLRDQPLLADELLDDIRSAAEERAPLSTRDRIRNAFVHHEVAFVGRPVCTIERVRVDGIEANWIYSEFVTDAPYEHVASFFDPRRWPELGPLFFKRMQLVDRDEPAPVAPPPVGDPHWQGVFLEEVQLVRRLRTLLNCSYWRSEAAAATTYDLKGSVDDEIDVDRGYLLVTRDGDMNRVQVLKIVSFTDDFWDAVAVFVCPFWTDWIRGAVQDATRTETTDPTHTPGPGRSPLGGAVEDWIDYFGRAAQPYLDLCTDASTRMRSGPYSPGDALADGARWWSQFAQDWARAWTNWSDTVQEVAEQGLDAGVTPPDVPPERRRGTVSALVAPAPMAGGTVVAVPVARLAGDKRPTCSELVSIDRSTATIPPNELSVTVEEGGRVRVRTTNPAAAQGLYIGQLQNAAKEALAPVQLYVSRATKV
jgi:hypothetical protein